MLITDFKEIVLIQMDRQNKTWKQLSQIIGKSPTYTKQVVSRIQDGPNARKYRQMIAAELGIVYAGEENK
ncbi:MULTISPECIES: hypothetical protein [Enterococcus]|uniref:Transcriptional regulator n=1 Tax=Enterococcus villorum TaxID=112904 RepID=A0A511J6G6_9ENTE|nr:MULTISPECIES: hypothetical protein [Enterococcus]GEL93293.1 hypothetical protein EVI01_26300 [Enterococcus villorum]